MRSTEQANDLHLKDEEWCLLLAAASNAIAVRIGLPERVSVSSTPDLFCVPIACFVTLTIDEQLRGCVGTLEASMPLLGAVQHYAQAAAVEDPRFPPLRVAEFDRIKISLSLLSAARPLHVVSTEDLLAQLIPGRHGLVIEYQGKQATFLPQVWDSLPQPDEFVRQLKRKAGLDEKLPSEQMRCSTYTVISKSS